MARKLLFLFVIAAITFGGITFADDTGRAQKIAEEKAALEAGDVTPWQPGDPVVRQIEPKDTGAPPQRLGPAISTIQYDDGVATAVPSVSSKTWGNRFNSQLGNAVAAGGQVTAVTFYMNSVSGTQAFVSFYDQLNTAGTAASTISSVNQGGIAPGWNTVATAQTYAGQSVIAGVWYSGSDVVALGTGTRMGQGHHGMHVQDFTGTSYSALTTLNALFRISGIDLPVELMSFEIE